MKSTMNWIEYIYLIILVIGIFMSYIGFNQYKKTKTLKQINKENVNVIDLERSTGSTKSSTKIFVNRMKNELNIPLAASFSGIKGINIPFVVSTNNFNPKLILKENEIEYKSGFLTKKKLYKDIELINVFINEKKLMGIITTNIIIEFSNSKFTFIGNLNNKTKLKDLVLFFKEKNIKISKKAIKLIK